MLRRIRSCSRSISAVIVLLTVAACATPTPVTEVGLNRDTPEKTYEYFKAMVRHNQHGAEWAVFSPNFKRMMNEMAGRNLDLGDYVTGRNTLASNSQADMQLLLNSELNGAARMLGPNQAVLTVSGGGRSISPRMVRLTRWELKVRGEDEPASGFISSAGDAVGVNADGSITVRVSASPTAASYLRTIPRDRIEGFAILSEWYVDDFGGLEGALSQGQASDTQQPQPGAYAPTRPSQPSTPAPSPVQGFGSPDG